MRVADPQNGLTRVTSSVSLVLLNEEAVPSLGASRRPNDEQLVAKSSLDEGSTSMSGGRGGSSSSCSTRRRDPNAFLREGPPALSSFTEEDGTTSEAASTRNEFPTDTTRATSRSIGASLHKADDLAGTIFARPTPSPPSSKR